ncbi:hypothetical protein GJV85_13265 (plasmid) [Sulfurimonas aquatica]|uniref:Uncharacterized protein n=1 Tax=Sulfurimonas aquatica TaxID=2672570 RepID=A0A975B2T1_9BACT|nr:hypothetical protein [Sulfurimonas aquatica]QSZ43139.1 hypothetical protein GJV85_13265 [Sulfurimonas aquatica]
MNFEEIDESKISSIANEMMDNLMDASTSIDHARHVKDFTDRLKNIVTKEYLTKVCEEYQKEKGLFAERKIIAVLRRPNSAIVIWKQKFTKVGGEYLAEMIIVHQNGKFLVDHTWVI